MSRTSRTEVLCQPFLFLLIHKKLCLKISHRGFKHFWIYFTLQKIFCFSSWYAAFILSGGWFIFQRWIWFIFSLIGCWLYNTISGSVGCHMDNCMLLFNILCRIIYGAIMLNMHLLSIIVAAILIVWIGPFIEFFNGISSIKRDALNMNFVV